MSAGEKYLWAAYLVVFVAVLVWVGIIALKLQRLEQEVGELVERAAAKPPVRAGGPVARARRG